MSVTMHAQVKASIPRGRVLFFRCSTRNQTCICLTCLKTFAKPWVTSMLLSVCSIIHVAVVVRLYTTSSNYNIQRSPTVLMPHSLPRRLLLQCFLQIQVRRSGPLFELRLVYRASESHWQTSSKMTQPLKCSSLLYVSCKHSITRDSRIVYYTF